VKVLKESIHVLACDSTWQRPGKIEAGKSHENSIQVANGHCIYRYFVLYNHDADWGHF
jgi:hypothetical protein